MSVGFRFAHIFVHGNALTVENPENLNHVGHFGWGAQMNVKHGQASWFHIALPTPVVLSNVNADLLRVWLLFRCDHGSIRNVHVYDGSLIVQQFDNLFIDGEHRFSVDEVNDFELATPHPLRFGIGVSFLFIADIGLEAGQPPSRLFLTSAGAAYNTGPL